jgi:hypothetical protein
MARVSGLWVYQRFGRPDADAVTAKAQSHGLQWVTVEAVEGTQVLGRAWLGEMRRATRERGMRLGVHGFVGRPTPRPLAEANAFATAIDVAQADFAIVNAEIQYETSPTPDSRDFTRRYRALKGDFPTYFSSFGRPEFHGRLNWAAWGNAGFWGMPQAYENLNPKLKPSLCIADWARFFDRAEIRPTLGCFAENGKPRLPLARLSASVREVTGLRFNVYRHGTVTDAELQALSQLT